MMSGMLRDNPLIQELWITKVPEHLFIQGLNGLIYLEKLVFEHHAWRDSIFLDFWPHGVLPSYGRLGHNIASWNALLDLFQVLKFVRISAEVGS